MARQNLLLVDGDTRSRRVLEVSLRKAGFSVTTAENLDQALLVLQHGEPDLIISDTRLQPERDGFEFCQEVKKNPKWASIPFVFLTSAKAIEDKVRGLELGVEDYLVKPIYIKEVTTRLRMLVQRKQRERLEKKDAARTKFTGHLADMAVVDLFQTIEISRKSGTIQFETELGEATIWFRDGSIIDAEMGRLQAEQAVYRLLGLNDGSFAVEFKPINRSSVIKESTQGLLMEGMRRVDEWGRLLEQLPPLDAVLAIDKAVLAELPEGTISSELQEVFRRFDGRRTILGVVDETGKDDLEALEAISSLYFMGLLTAPTDEVEEETVELGDSNPALRLEAWDVPAGSSEPFQPSQSTPESGPHAMPEEVPPMPSFPVSAPLAGDSGGLVAGLPDETLSLGDGLTPLAEVRPERSNDPMLQALEDRFDGLATEPDDDGNPAFSQLGRTLKAIIEAGDNDDALALTAPVEAEPAREITARRSRAEQEEAARGRALDELERREAERSMRGSVVEPETSKESRSEESLRKLEEARERSRSLTEPMFVAPRPAPVVANDEEDGPDDPAAASGSTPMERPLSAEVTELEASEVEPVTEAEARLVVGGAPARSEPPPMKPEARRLAAPAPRTEPVWTRPPTLAELGLDASGPPTLRTRLPEPEAPAETKQEAANEGPGKAKDSSVSPAASGVITTPKDEFEPVAVRMVEPARESLPGDSLSSARPVEEASREPALDTTESTTDGGPKLGLWVILVVAASVIGLVVFRDALFGRQGTSHNPRATEPGDQAVLAADDTTSGREPEMDTTPEVASGATGDAPPGETESETQSDESGGSESEEGASIDAETGELDIEAELASARRMFKFRRTEAAKEVIEGILAVEPDHAQTLMLRAQILAEAGEIADALAAARRANLANPDDAEVYPMLAALLEAHAEPDAALAAYQRYLELDPHGKYARVARLAIRRLEKPQ